MQPYVTSRTRGDERCCDQMPRWIRESRLPSATTLKMGQARTRKHHSSMCRKETKCFGSRPDTNYARVGTAASIFLKGSESPNRAGLRPAPP